MRPSLPRRLLLALAPAAIAALTLPAQAADPIKIGEINSYSRMAAFTEPYQKGWQLALEQTNAAGGIHGRPLEVISRDDAGEPANAVKIYEEMLVRDKVALVFGGFLSNVGLAMADFALQSKSLYLASEPLTDALIWSQGNRYTFRLRPSTTMQAAMLAEQAAKLGKTRWATVAPNYAYGKDAVEAFKIELKKRQPTVVFVEEQWPALFKIDAGATVRALEAAKPDAIFNVTFSTDLTKFVREGQLRELFVDRPVVSILTGEPEYFLPLKNDGPEGWIVTGYPVTQITDSAHVAFVEAYRARFNEDPAVGSLVGYISMQSVAALLNKSPTLDAEALVDTLAGLSIDTPIGPISYREIDHQATMGAWVGKTTVKDGVPTMVDWFYAPGDKYLPTDDVVRTLRPAAQP